MKNLIENTIGKIKQQQLKPAPKWKYLARKYGSWGVFGLIVVLGSLSLSAGYFIIANLDWDLYRFMHQSMLGYSLSIFPYFWAILIAIFLAAAFFDIRKTETGYRFSWLKISLITLGSIILLGLIMSLFGIGGRFNSMMTKGVPYYGKHMMVTRESQWMQPEKGFLAGTINSVSDNEIVISDLNRRNWNVQFSEKTLIRPSVDIKQGGMIKIIGKKLGENKFEASEIRPWIGRGMMDGQQRRFMINGSGMMRNN